METDDIEAPSSAQYDDKRLKNLHCLLDYIDCLDGAPETEASQQFNIWVDAMEQLRSEPTEDPLKASLVCYSNPMVGRSRQLCANIRDCLLNHRWLDAGKLLLELMEEPICQPIDIWRCNCEVMWQLREDLRGEHARFVKQMTEMRSLPKEFITIEYAMFLLSDGKIDEAYNVFKTCEVRSKDQSSVYFSTMFKVYKGLFAFVEWKKVLKDIDSGTDENELVVLRQQAEDLSERARQLFLSVKAADMNVDMMLKDKYDEMELT